MLQGFLEPKLVDHMVVGISNCLVVFNSNAKQPAA